MDHTLTQLKEAIIQADTHQVDQLLSDVNGKADFDIIFTNCITPALNTLCTAIQQKQCAMPELLMGLKQVNRIIQSLSEDRVANAKPKQTIIIGVIEGDIHDMGKNIVRDVCKGYGFDVTDLGKNVSPKAFVESAEARQADVACLSTMLSTTIDSMEHTIRNLKMSRPGIQVLIGGAFMNDEIASRVGADGYAENAAAVKSVIERVLQ